MGVETITSRSNPLMSHIRKLVSSGAHRRKSGEFVCDGRKLLGEAQQWHVPVSAVVFCDGEKPPEVPGARLVQVSREMMDYIAPSDTPQGVLAVCTRQETPLPEVLTGSRYILLDSVQDPGNVGTILRNLFWTACRSYGGGLRGSVQPQNCARYHGRAVPPPGVEVCAGAGKGAALRRRYPVVGGCAALRYGGCPAGGLYPCRCGHWQRRAGAERRSARLVRSDDSSSHE